MFKLFSKLLVQREQKIEQAVLIHLDSTNLDGSDRSVFDFSELEDQLAKALEGIGELDGNEIGGGEYTIFLYGNDAEEIFERIAPLLRESALSRNGSATIRKGPPGSSEREVDL